MKRYTDKPYYSFTAYEALSDGLCVKCPACGQLGIVKIDEVFRYFHCTHCSKQIKEERQEYNYLIEASCQACGRYFRVKVTDKAKQPFKVLNVGCPHCNHLNAAPMQKIPTGIFYLSKIRQGYEPNFGFSLYYQGVFDGQLVWAINRPHLQYLIDYISADLRVKDGTASITTKTQADHLPTFMKLAKNRDGVVKLLKKMQTSF